MSEHVWTFPPEDAAPATPAAETAGQKITDHVAQATERLTQQFKTKAKIVSFLGACVEPVQRLENALWQLLTERSIDTAIGVQLDDIGSKVGQPRLGFSDTDYRRLIKARIAANRSAGLVSDLIKISVAVVNDVAATIDIDQQGVAAVVVTIEGVIISETTASILIDFLRDSVAAGVRVLLEYPTALGTDVFRFLGGTPVSDGFADAGTPGTGGKFASVKE